MTPKASTARSDPANRRDRRSGLRDAAGIVAVGLVAHGAQRRLHMPRFHHHGPEAGIPKAVDQPLGQRAGLQSDGFDPFVACAVKTNKDGSIEGFTLKVWTASFLFSGKLAKADEYCVGHGQQEFIK